MILFFIVISKDGCVFKMYVFFFLLMVENLLGSVNG